MPYDLNTVIDLIKADNKVEALEVLKSILRQNPSNEGAWLWVVELMPTTLAKTRALQECLKHVPNSQKAHDLLLHFEQIAQKQSHPAAAPVPSTPVTLLDAVQDSPLLRKKFGLKPEPPKPERNLPWKKISLGVGLFILLVVAAVIFFWLANLLAKVPPPATRTPRPSDTPMPTSTHYPTATSQFSVPMAPSTPAPGRVSAPASEASLSIYFIRPGDGLYTLQNGKPPQNLAPGYPYNSYPPDKLEVMIQHCGSAETLVGGLLEGPVWQAGTERAVAAAVTYYQGSYVDAFYTVEPQTCTARKLINFEHLPGITTFSPDGRYVVISGMAEISLYDLVAGKIVSAPVSYPNLGDPFSNSNNVPAVSWALDSRSFLVIVRPPEETPLPGGAEPPSAQSRAIQFYQAFTDGTAKKLAGLPLEWAVASPVLSLDGTYLVGTLQNVLHIYKLVGNNEEAVLDKGGKVMSWSPDGKKFIFTTDGGQSFIGLLDGQSLPLGGEVKSPRGIAWLSADSLVYVASVGGQGNLYLQKIGLQPELLTGPIGTDITKISLVALPVAPQNLQIPGMPTAIPTP